MATVIKEASPNWAHGQVSRLRPLTPQQRHDSRHSGTGALGQQRSFRHKQEPLPEEQHPGTCDDASNAGGTRDPPSEWGQLFEKNKQRE